MPAPATISAMPASPEERNMPAAARFRVALACSVNSVFNDGRGVRAMMESFRFELFEVNGEGAQRADIGKYGIALVIPHITGKGSGQDNFASFSVVVVAGQSVC